LGIAIPPTTAFVKRRPVTTTNGASHSGIHIGALPQLARDRFALTASLAAAGMGAAGPARAACVGLGTARRCARRNRPQITGVG
jgi:hypothetical protein